MHVAPALMRRRLSFLWFAREEQDHDEAVPTLPKAPSPSSHSWSVPGRFKMCRLSRLISQVSLMGETWMQFELSGV